MIGRRGILVRVRESPNVTATLFEQVDSLLATVLDNIIAQKKWEIEQARAICPTVELERLVQEVPQPRPFVAALRANGPVALIAEVKKASPSAGVIRADFDPLEIAKTYVAHGAACLSVLTDEKFFQGSLEYLRQIRAEVGIPVMRKDFLIDRYQVLEARAAGADCILLIAECLNDCQMRDLYFYASELGMDALIEVYDPENLDRVLRLDPPLIGVNNRDLRTFVTDLEQTIRLAERIPRSTLLVSESGIRTPADVGRLREAGIGAILVGESLMRSPDIGKAVDALLARAE